MFPTISSKKKKNLTVVALCAVVLLLAATVGVLYWKYQQAKTSLSEEEQTSARIVEEVSNLYMTPTNEEPTVALIQDRNKLGNQEFFKSAQNGDYLLVYREAKLAMIYRENAKKLVRVGPVDLGDEQGDEDQPQEAQTAGAQTEAETETETEPTPETNEQPQNQ